MFRKSWLASRISLNCLAGKGEGFQVLSLDVIKKYGNYVYLLTLLFTLNLVDAATTLYGLNHGATELNPFYNVQNLWGKITAPVFFAVLWFSLYAYCDLHGHAKIRSTLKILLAIVLGIYVLVVFNNLLTLSFLL